MFKKNSAGTFTFVMVSATTGAGMTGLTPTVKRTIDSGNQGDPAGSVAETAGGEYRFSGLAADFNGDSVGFLITATGAIPVHRFISTESKKMADLNDAAAAPTTGAIVTAMDGSSAKLANLDAAVTGIPAAVWAYGTRGLTTLSGMASAISNAVWGIGNETTPTYGSLIWDMVEGVWGRAQRLVTGGSVTASNMVAPAPTAATIAGAVLDEAKGAHTGLLAGVASASALASVAADVTRIKASDYDSFTATTEGTTDTLHLSNGATHIVTPTGRVTTEA